MSSAFRLLSSPFRFAAAKATTATDAPLPGTETSQETSPVPPKRPLSTTQSTLSTPPRSPEAVHFPQHLQELLSLFRNQEKCVNALLKSRDKKPLSDEENALLLDKYECFLQQGSASSSSSSSPSSSSSSSSAQSNEQKLSRIVNALRSNNSTLIEELELLLFFCKDLHDTALCSSREIQDALASTTNKLSPLILMVLSLREQQFLHELRGRSDSTERSSLVRNYIAAATHCLEAYASHIPENKRMIDLSRVHIEHVDFSGLALSFVHFGAHKSVRFCNFFGAEIDAEQLKDVKGLEDTHYLDESVRTQALKLKMDRLLESVRARHTALSETQRVLQALPLFSRLVFSNENDGNNEHTQTYTLSLTERLCDVSDDDLRTLSLALCLDDCVNALPASSFFSAAWLTTHREEVLVMSREDLLYALQSVIDAREGALPEEVLLLAVDAQLSLARASSLPPRQPELPSAHTQSHTQSHIELQAVSLSRFFPASETDSLSSLFSPAMLDNLYEKISLCEALDERVQGKREQLQRANDDALVAALLRHLNAPVDARLRYSATERLQRVFTIMRHTERVLDLREIDLSQVRFVPPPHNAPTQFLPHDTISSASEQIVSGIDFSHVLVSLSHAQETQLLTAEHIEQRYAQLFSVVRDTQRSAEDVHLVLQQCNLDVNHAQRRDGRTALMLACCLRRADIVCVLLERHNARTDVRDDSGWDALSLLCCTGFRRRRSYASSLSHSRREGDFDSEEEEEESERGSVWESSTTRFSERSSISEQIHPKEEASTAKRRRSHSMHSVQSAQSLGNSAGASVGASQHSHTRSGARTMCIDGETRAIIDLLLSHGAYLSVHNAAYLGDIERLQHFSREELCSLCPVTGWSLAHIASRDNNVEMLRFLRRNEFDFSILASMPAHANGGLSHTQSSSNIVASASIDGLSRAQSVSSSSNKRSGVSFNTTNSSVLHASMGPTALWIACVYGSLDAALELLQYAPSLRETAFLGQTPIKIALRERHLHVVKALKDANCLVDVEIAIALEDDDWMRQHLQNVRCCGGDIASHSNKEKLQSALLLACRYGWEKLVKHLLEEYGDEIDLSTKYSSLSAVFSLSEDEDDDDEEEEATIVDLVCQWGHASLMKIFLHYAGTRFDINEASSFSVPPLLFRAMQSRHWDIVSLILEHKPDLSVTFLDRPPLHALLVLKNVPDGVRNDLVKKMIEAKADVLQFDGDGCTALHHAAAVSEDAATLILKAFIGLKDNAGKDAIDLANEANVDVPTLKI